MLRADAARALRLLADRGPLPRRHFDGLLDPFDFRHRAYLRRQRLVTDRYVPVGPHPFAGERAVVAPTASGALALERYARCPLAG
jgi:hypothetical protein